MRAVVVRLWCGVGGGGGWGRGLCGSSLRGRLCGCVLTSGGLNVWAWWGEGGMGNGGVFERLVMVG